LTAPAPEAVSDGFWSLEILSGGDVNSCPYFGDAIHWFSLQFIRSLHLCTNLKLSSPACVTFQPVGAVGPQLEYHA